MVKLQKIQNVSLLLVSDEGDLKKNIFFKEIYYTESIYKVYKDKLQNCSCNHSINMYLIEQVEMNSMDINIGVNSGSEK